jgi:hypothetical protein
MIVICFSSKGAKTTAEKSNELGVLIKCDQNNVEFFRINLCQNKDCTDQCLKKYGADKVQFPNCNGRDTCVCCNDHPPPK